MTNTQNTTANTIIEQLGGFGKLKAMTGAKDFTSVENGVCFKFKNPNRNRPNYIMVVLAGDDTYNVTMAKLVRFEPLNQSTVSGIQVGQIKELFENATGLCLSL